MASKKFTGFFDGHLQYFINALAFVLHFQGFTVVAFAFTDITGHIDIRQEVHLNLDHTITLTGFTTATFDVKAEPSRLITP